MEIQILGESIKEWNVDYVDSILSPSLYVHFFYNVHTSSKLNIS